MKKPIRKHTIETLTTVILDKNLQNIIKVVNIEGSRVIVNDTWYGNYYVDLKAFCESTDFPMHKGRRFFIRMQAAAVKLVGKNINGFKINELFYGPDRGYKNRSFYAICEAPCGHNIITTAAHLKKHKHPDSGCGTCSKTEHGARGLKDGVRIKRTPTYNHWQRVRKNLPEFLQSFSDFKRILGDKPNTFCQVITTPDGQAFWSNTAATTDKENTIIATAVRQAFRRSQLYKDCVNTAKVETIEGTRYKCAMCGELFKYSQIQVDHIDPVSPLSGDPLLREDIINRTWTSKIQILDKICHAKKSTEENKLRKINRYKGKKNNE